MRIKYMNIINELSTINKEAPCPQQRYTVFGKISAAILSDSLTDFINYLPIVCISMKYSS
jgi:hypothetical protein